MLDLPEYVWQDIEDVMNWRYAPTTNERANRRKLIDAIIEIVDMERIRQQREAMISEGRVR